jgi:hypothetical protein
LLIIHNYDVEFAGGFEQNTYFLINFFDYDSRNPTHATDFGCSTVLTLDQIFVSAPKALE